MSIIEQASKRKINSIHPNPWQMARYFILPEFIDRIKPNKPNLVVAAGTLTAAAYIVDPPGIIAQFNPTESVIDEIKEAEAGGWKSITFEELQNHIAKTARWAIPAYGWTDDPNELVNQTFISRAVAADSNSEVSSRFRKDYPTMDISDFMLSEMRVSVALFNWHGFNNHEGSVLNLNVINYQWDNAVTFKGDFNNLSCEPYKAMTAGRIVAAHEWEHAHSNGEEWLSKDSDLYYLIKQSYRKQAGIQEDIDLDINIEGFRIVIRGNHANYTYNSFDEFTTDYVTDMKAIESDLPYITFYLKPHEIEKWKRILDKGEMSNQDLQDYHEHKQILEFLHRLKDASEIVDDDEDTWINLFQATFGWPTRDGDWKRLTDLYPGLVDDTNYRYRYTNESGDGCLITPVD